MAFIALAFWVSSAQPSVGERFGEGERVKRRRE
jgi:hypothetical protein